MVEDKKVEFGRQGCNQLCHKPDDQVAAELEVSCFHENVVSLTFWAETPEALEIGVDAVDKSSEYSKMEPRVMPSCCREPRVSQRSVSGTRREAFSFRRSCRAVHRPREIGSVVISGRCCSESSNANCGACRILDTYTHATLSRISLTLHE